MDVLSMKARVAGLLSWISLYTGHDLPGTAPDIVCGAHEKTERLACQDE